MLVIKEWFYEVVIELDDEKKNILYKRQFRVLKTIYNKEGITSYPITDWQPEENIDYAMTYCRNEMDNNEFCFYSYEERYIPTKED